MKPALPNLRHLRAFREVADCRNISLASNRVHLSQPAITQAIAKLETILGTSLFDRRSDGMFVTEPGKRFRMRVDRALSLLEQGAAKALQIAPKRHGRGFNKFDQLLTSAQLRALIAVSRAENFSLAAKRIGISQPSLHRAARDLERLAGIVLFEKVSQGIRLTPPAHVLAQHAKLTMAEMRQGYDEIEERKGMDVSRITVGSLPLARTYVLPHAIHRLGDIRPDVQVSVVDGPYDDLLHALRHGDIDILIGALRDPLPIDDVQQHPLFTDQLTMAARAGHPLADKRRLKLADLAGYPWVVPRHGTPTRAHIERIFSEAQVAPRLVEASSLVLARGLLLRSDRLTIISAHQIRYELERGLLVSLPLDMPKMDRPIGVTLRRDWQPTASQDEFLNAIRHAGDKVGALK